MSSSILKAEYSMRSQKFYELPDDIEIMLEEDYVKNSYMYTDDIFEAIQIYTCIMPEDFNNQTIFEAILNLVRNSQMTKEIQ